MQKLKLFCAISCLSIPAFADSGFYFGVAAGYGTINTSTSNGFVYPDNVSNKSGGNMTGGLFAGYDFNPYVGIQADYDYISNVEFTMGSTVPGITGTFNASQQLLDLGVVGHLPFSLFANSLSGLSLFGKLAVAYTTTNFNGGSLVAPGAGNLQLNLPNNSSNAAPVIGLGAEYGWTNVGLRLEYDYVGSTAISTNNQTIMNVNNDLTLFSVLYHF